MGVRCTVMESVWEASEWGGVSVIALITLNFSLSLSLSLSLGENCQLRVGIQRDVAASS